MTDVFGHGFVLLQLFEEDVFVKVQHVFHVGEEDVLLVDEAGLRFKLAALVTQGVVVQLHADLQVFDVRLLRLQQLGHDEPSRGTQSVKVDTIKKNKKNISVMMDVGFTLYDGLISSCRHRLVERAARVRHEAVPAIPAALPSVISVELCPVETPIEAYEQK